MCVRHKDDTDTHTERDFLYKLSGHGGEWLGVNGGGGGHHQLLLDRKGTLPCRRGVARQLGYAE